MSPARARPAALRLVALAVACALATAAVYHLAVGTSAGQGVDDALRGGVGFEQGSVHAAGNELLNTVSVSSLALMGALVMALALARRRPRLAAGAGVLVLGANITVQVMKRTLDRPRLGGAWWDQANSFPSGHATVGMSLAMALILVAPPALRGASAVAGSFYALGIGMAVIALDWHRPSDVLGSYLVATAWTAVVAAALVAWPDRPRRAAAVDARTRAWSAGLALVTAAVVAIAVVRVAAAPEVAELLVDRTRVVATGAATAVAGVGLIAAVMGLTRPRAGAGRAARRAR